MSSPQKIIGISKRQRMALRAMIIIGLLSIANFAYWFYSSSLIGYAPLFWLLVITLVYAVARILYEWYHYWDISIPSQASLTTQTTPPTVDILTTYFPGEPYEMVVNTLEAIQKITYPHTTYLCDEANDPHLIAICKQLGVIHVTRDHRIDAKAGNINNALQQASGEICVILDPDHIPQSNFLDPIIPHFSDPKMGFVQIVQAYYNIYESYVAKGAAQQTFQFYGPMMMTMNSYGTVNAIGANCTFRREALDSIGGHAAGLSEDMHTAMQLHAKGWKSVYVPEVLATGMVPSTLTAYYKQQLKWSRGTLDLLCNVYPKLFSQFTWRQKIHYGILPLHYLIGIVYLINFMIPIVALITSEMPWRGNLLFFGIINTPVIASTLLIRLYVQRWVMNEEERGFHLVGGLLQISAWWIFLLGFVYTVIGKKIPYLPTPKDGSDKSTWQILAPNCAIGVLSLLAIGYGLTRDFTPFTLFMSGFALLNAFFMFFTVYLANHTYTNLDAVVGAKKILSTSVLRSKQVFWGFRHKIYKLSRAIALPLLLLVVITSACAVHWTNQSKWENIKTDRPQENPVRYIGIFSPKKQGGLTDISQVKKIEKESNMDFNIVSLYLAWGEKNTASFPHQLLKAISDQKAIPMITWEPWASGFSTLPENTLLQNEQKVFQHIAEGYYDSYIKTFALHLKAYKAPVFLRFAHEFDNPAYPWSSAGKNTAKEYKSAWRHVHGMFKSLDINNVIWVWNPWKAEAIADYYPGAAYVDWVGITGLNYGPLNPNKKWYSFEQLYAPFRTALHPLKQHPVMIAEFGTLKTGGNQQQWIANAFDAIDSKFPEVRAVVFFNSKIDTNIPNGLATYKSNTIDWSIPDFSKTKPAFNFQEPPAYIFEAKNILALERDKETASPMEIPRIRGVNYKKGQNWYNDYYTLTRKYLEQDFAKMKQLGINTLKYQASTIYDYNIMNIASEFDLKVAYSFWVPETLDFIEDKVAADRLAQSILETVTEHRDNSPIVSWHISNTIWAALEQKHNEPVATYQQHAYIHWLKGLLVELKQIDPKRPVVIDLELNNKTLQTAKFIHSRCPQIAAYGLVVSNTNHLQTFREGAEKLKLPYLYSDVEPDMIKHIPDVETPWIFLRNWQDEQESNKISFDGLLDHKDRFKKGYVTMFNRWNNDNDTTHLPAIKILKPTKLTFTGDILSYYAVLDLPKGWSHPNPDTSPYTFEWSLIKNDTYGNPLAIKKLGIGTSINVKTPAHHQEYQLHLSITKNHHVMATKTSLNTPLTKEGKKIQY